MMVFSFLLACGPRIHAQSVFINEIHYDNDGTDANEGVEIAGPAGTNLGDYELIFYNGTGRVGAATIATAAGTQPLTGMVPDFGAGYGVVWFAIGGIENGNNDGVVLRQKSTSQIIQFLSWEGALTAAEGPATGLLSTEMKTATGTPVLELMTSPLGFSLQLRGTGTVYTDFSWTAPAAATRGGINNQQTLGSVVFNTTLTLSQTGVDESFGTVMATLTLNPPPATARTFWPASSDTTEATVPSSVIVPTSGSVTFPVTILNDGIVDGSQTVIISVTDPAALYPGKTKSLTVRDASAPPPAFNGVLRVACLNVLFGVNAPGSNEYLAVKEQVERINPQVICFEEVDSANNFADMKSLLIDLGFPITSQYFATTGDGFGTFVSGDFSNLNQCVCLASKFPITQTVQIGRGIANQVEMTRFPLFVAIDLPGVNPADDPAFVAVHLKASGTNADQFRRAIEGYRISQYLQTNGWDGNSKNVFVMGDFNEQDDFVQPTSFFTGIDTATYVFPDNLDKLPGSYKLGADIAGANGITLPYNTFPHSAFTGIHLSAPETRQADGVTRITYNLNGNARLDYIFARTPVTSQGLFAAEVYNSRLEAAFDGLPKNDLPTPGSLPIPELSYLASDHFGVFADVSIGLRPKVILTPSVPFVNEAETSEINLTVGLSQAPATGQTVTVTLAPFRPGRVILPVTTVTFTAGQTSAVVPMQILHPPGVDPHRTVTISATADGWFPGRATVEVRNQEAGGLTILSQYLEPSATSGPKSVEILNQSGTTLDFSKTPLFVRRFTNGDSAGVNEAKVTYGTLDAGLVMVIGDAATGDYLLAQGVIQSDPVYTPASAPSGTPFYDSLGRLRFWKDTFTYNGNDALEVLLNYTRMDVFGTIGVNPGTAWTGSGVSTANQNIELKSTVGTGTSGFSDPSTRFVIVSASDELTGFGIAPTLADEYLAWAAIQGLSGLNKAPDSDVDGDGLKNLLEYALQTSATIQTPQPLEVEKIFNPDRVRVSAALLTPTAGNGLNYTLEQSSDLANFASATPTVSLLNLGNGMERRSFDVPITAGGRVFFRLRVKK